jgi:hypothetical protein
MRVVGEGNGEFVSVGGDAEGERVHPVELILASGDSGFAFHPAWPRIGL